MSEWVSATCGGERCSFVGCDFDAYAKVGEEIPFDDPNPKRHNLTAYVCRDHFIAIMGSYGVASRQRWIARKEPPHDPA